MKYSIFNNFIFRLDIFLLLAAVLLTVGYCFAQNSHSEGWILPAHYPAHFSGYGCLNRIEGDEVVIDDQFYRLAPNATFQTPRSQNSTTSLFRKGARVGIIITNNKEIESLWYIDKCK